MKLAKNVYNYDNHQLLVSAGTILTDETISRLAYYSIIDVHIDETYEAEPKEEETGEAEESSYVERLRRTPQFIKFKADFEENADLFEKRINQVVKKNGDLHVDSLVEPVLKMVDDTGNPSSVFDMLHALRSYDDLTYMHSINVSLICNVLGQWLKFDDEEVRVLTAAGLLHDVGKILVPGDLIAKPSKLTKYEYAIVQRHAYDGYMVLKDLDINEHIKNAALMHHERMDGSGYPLHLKGEQIDSYAKIVAIADVYDAMTSPRVYRGALCPFVAISMFEREGLQKYESKYILTFLECIVNTYLLNRVRLTNGMEGEIVFINREFLSKPTIKVGDAYVDLTQYPDIAIEKII